MFSKISHQMNKHVLWIAVELHFSIEKTAANFPYWNSIFECTANAFSIGKYNDTCHH